MLTATNIEEIFRVCDAFRRASERFWDMLLTEPPEKNRVALKAIHEISTNCQNLKSWCTDQAQTLDVGPDEPAPADVLPATMEPEAVVHVEPFGSECVTSSSVQVSAWEATP